MDLSALIFVALALAWAVYLVPKALKHHEESVRNRSAERFATRMRSLAGRAPTPGREGRLVVSPGRASSGPVVTRKPRSGAESVAAPDAAPTSEGHRTASGSRSERGETPKVAARRRRRVLGLLGVALVTVGVLAVTEVLHPAWLALPAGLVVAWLVTCRLAVRAQHRQPPVSGQVPQPAGARAPQEEPVMEPAAKQAGEGHRADSGTSAEVLAARQAAAEADTGEIPRVEDSPAPGGESGADVAASGAHPAAGGAGVWDPQPATLPTYVSKPAAHPRAPRGIDLDSTGVWTSGRTQHDAALAREAEEVERAARDAGADRQQRRTGS